MALRSSPVGSLTGFLVEAAPAFAPDRPLVPGKPERRTKRASRRRRGQTDDQIEPLAEATVASAATAVRIALPAALFVVALVLFAVRLGAANTYAYDEVYHAFTAAEYLKGNADAHMAGHAVPEPKPNPNVAYEWTHPPLGKLLIAVGIFAFGDEPVGWRAMSTLFGAIGIVVVYFLGWQLTGRWTVGLLASSLLMVDGLYFAQSRTGTLDIFIVTFTTSALLAFLIYLRAPPDAARRALLVTGLCIGCAIAIKWNGAYASVFIGLVALWRVGRLWVAGSKPGAPPAVIRGARQQALWIPVALIAVPLLVYLASYIPFFLSGYGMADLIDLHQRMFRYHSQLKSTHPYASIWWTWPLDWNPVLYDLMWDGPKSARAYGMGNPLIFWALVPSVAAVAWSWWRTHHRAALTVLLIGFFGQWLIWMFSPRTAYMYHFLPAVPFGVIAIATLLEAGWRRATRPARAVVRGYLIAVIIFFAFFYPIWASVWLTPERLEMRIWFESWR
ncbi:MAG: phospholipid carrier-dependent glycosyltransferase [Chloroflexia bacterium]|nr:phospholipid carrier-dependent glycosyltransferase [Chloroflexia bacterium]